MGKDAVREHKRLLRKLSLRPTSDNLSSYRQAAAAARSTIRQSKRESWRQYVSKLNSQSTIKSAWDRLRKIRGKGTSDGYKHLNVGGTAITSQLGISNELAIPSSWLEATVIPIPKPGKYQSGFRRNRSTIDHLVRFETLVREAFIRREHLAAVFFDLEKAYETTSKYGILRDLFNSGLRGRMPIFISNFLHHRKFRVRVGATFFDHFDLEMGVPQGSKLSVTLFSLKINDIVNHVKSGTECFLYVDDLVVAYASKSISTIEKHLQLSLNKIEKWTNENGFKFSSSKTVRVTWSNRMTFLGAMINSITPIEKKLSSFIHQKNTMSLCPNPSLSSRLPDKSSIFSAESKALLLALDIVENSTYGRYIILSDSLSCLMALDNMKYSHPTICDILVKLHLLTKSNHVIFCWLPSHVGISGNEKADLAAKSALSLPVDPQFIYFHDFYMYIFKHTLSIWQSKWDGEINNKLHAIKPKLGEWALSYRKSRKEESILCRLRVGHTYLTHSFLLRNEAQPVCGRCQQPLTVRHVLVDCVALTSVRSRFYSPLPWKNFSRRWIFVNYLNF
ncbi:RNA-directed DNA polymerase from mobile element jockey [Nymphon striatum]|nr:RNA-directed DNA polymerase from mobile element jockey [Nymphon striatum]